MALRDILRQAGFSGAALETAYAIAMAESGGNARAFNGNRRTGDNSYGLFQINMIGGMGPERRRQFGLSANDDLYDPLTNAKVAYRMSKGGKNWTPWSTFNNDTYRRYLNGQGGTEPVTPTMTTATGAATPKPAAPLTVATGSADIIGSGSNTFSPNAKSFGPQHQDFTNPVTPAAGGTGGVGTTGAISGNSGLRDKVIAAAMGVLGTPYSWGGGTAKGPSRGFGRGAGTVGFDCSSLVMYAFAQAGYSMARTARPQLASGVKVPISQLKPGDLLGWGSPAHHIAIYLGNGQYIQAPSTGGHVEVKSLGSGSSAWGVHLQLPGD